MLLQDLGQTALMIDRFEEALEIYDQVLLIEPTNAEYWFWRGVTLEKLNRKAEALASLNKALILNPEFLPAQEWRNKMETGEGF